jgi:hypothetical protein
MTDEGMWWSLAFFPEIWSLKSKQEATSVTPRGTDYRIGFCDWDVKQFSTLYLNADKLMASGSNMAVPSTARTDLQRHPSNRIIPPTLLLRETGHCA